MSFREHEADVLVVGGGFGGCMTACAAAEKGVKVLMVTKSTLESGGSARPGFQGGLNVFPRSEVKIYSSAGESCGSWKPQNLEKFWKNVEIQRVHQVSHRTQLGDGGKARVLWYQID